MAVLNNEQGSVQTGAIRKTRAILKRTFRHSRLNPRFIGRNRLPELTELEELIALLSDRADVEELVRVSVNNKDFPVYGITMGSKDPQAPVLGFFGGVHGLERIGTHVVLAYLHTITELLMWDDLFNEKLAKTRLIFVPLVNPGGMHMRWRANVNGVDLMRNAPVEAEASDKKKFLLSGHRYGPHLPWYRGPENAPMEAEAQALCNFVRRNIKDSVASIALDVHSGFGAVDRLWFPYAKSTKPFPSLAEFYAFNQLFNRSYPNHFYRIEPQALSYTTHGDLWDYMYDDFMLHKKPHQVFLPLCLEMGSWSWVRKNPWQIFSALGPFNPIQLHRHQRILRRHYTLFDFLQRSAYSHHIWSQLDNEERERFFDEAYQKWYER